MKIKQIPASEVIAQLKAGARVMVAKELYDLKDLEGAEIYLIADKPADPEPQPVAKPRKETHTKAKRIDYAEVERMAATGIPKAMIAQKLGCSEWSIAQHLQKKKKVGNDKGDKAGS